MRTTGWYSNDNLVWIWVKCIIVITSVSLLAYFVGLDIESHFSAIVFVPLILSIFSSYSYFSNKSGSNDDSE